MVHLYKNILYNYIMIYQDKYLKYKKKYFELKGGMKVPPPVAPKKY
jgi:hypothetical protein